ncbi:hypothetical protein SAY87_015321 [Trapa incisa]|uniref:Uncharacterized protein n=1 Tax=Trapa incisa TaxID=236973 RepID=A0AAN7JLW7_9MYRT|nr:hypothetical protein SAY87_015321 [Trapa incisa]
MEAMNKWLAFSLSGGGGHRQPEPQPPASIQQGISDWTSADHGAGETNCRRVHQYSSESSSSGDQLAMLMSGPAPGSSSCSNNRINSSMIPELYDQPDAPKLENFLGLHPFAAAHCNNPYTDGSTSRPNYLAHYSLTDNAAAETNPCVNLPRNNNHPNSGGGGSSSSIGLSMIKSWLRNQPLGPPAGVNEHGISSTAMDARNKILTLSMSAEGELQSLSSSGAPLSLLAPAISHGAGTSPLVQSDHDHDNISNNNDSDKLQQDSSSSPSPYNALTRSFIHLELVDAEHERASLQFIWGADFPRTGGSLMSTYENHGGGSGSGSAMATVLGGIHSYAEAAAGWPSMAGSFPQAPLAGQIPLYGFGHGHSQGQSVMHRNWGCKQEQPEQEADGGGTSVYTDHRRHHFSSLGMGSTTHNFFQQLDSGGGGSMAVLPPSYLMNSAASATTVSNPDFHVLSNAAYASNVAEYGGPITDHHDQESGSGHHSVMYGSTVDQAAAAYGTYQSQHSMDGSGSDRYVSWVPTGIPVAAGSSANASSRAPRVGNMSMPVNHHGAPTFTVWPPE